MNTVNFLTVIPYTIDSYRYFINDDMTSSHVMKQDDMYRYICTLIKPPATTIALGFMEKHFAFITSIRKNIVQRFEFDSSVENQQMRMKTLNPNRKEIEKIKNSEKNTIDDIRQKWTDNMNKRYSNEVDKWSEKKYNNDRRKFL